MSHDPHHIIEVLPVHLRLALPEEAQGGGTRSNCANQRLLRTCLMELRSLTMDMTSFLQGIAPRATNQLLQSLTLLRCTPQNRHKLHRNFFASAISVSRPSGPATAPSRRTLIAHSLSCQICLYGTRPRELKRAALDFPGAWILAVFALALDESDLKMS